MSNLLKSKFLLGVMTVAIMVVGAFAVSATQASADCTVVPTLRLGSSSESVACLQSKLNLTADSKFGPATNTAVKAFQASKGLTADGVVGPATALALNGVVAGNLPAGCTSTAGYSTTLANTPCSGGSNLPAGCTSASQLYSTVDGKSCTVASSFPAGCTSAVGYSPTTSHKCDGSQETGGPGVGGLTGGAADIVVSNYSSGTNKEVNEGQSEKVMGFKVEATDGDVAITNLKLTMLNLDTGGAYTLTKYVDSVDVYVGSTKVASADASDFTKNNSTSYVCGGGVDNSELNTCYTKTISIPNSIVKKGSNNKVAFNVQINAASSIDSANIGHNDWLVAITDIRFMDSTGMVLTSGTIQGITGVKFTNLSHSGGAKLAISKESTPATGNVEVSSTSTTPDIKMLGIKLKATGTDMSFDNLSVSLVGTYDTHNAENLRDTIDSLELRDGSDVIASDPTIGSNQSGEVTFALDNTYTISAGDTATLGVYLKAKKINDATFNDGDTLKVNFDTDQIRAEDANGDVVTNEVGTAHGNVQTFQSSGATVTKVTLSPDYAVPTVDSNGDGHPGFIKLKFKVQSFGDTQIVIGSDGSGLTWDLANADQSGGAFVQTQDLTLDGGDYTLQAGDSATFTLTLSIAQGSTSFPVGLTLLTVNGSPVTNVDNLGNQAE